jgi:hypothetical protein
LKRERAGLISNENEEEEGNEKGENSHDDRE